MVISGIIQGHPREAMKRLVRAQGGRISESVSKKTDLLICGANPGSKLDKARALGVRVIDAEEFERLIDTSR